MSSDSSNIEENGRPRAILQAHDNMFWATSSTPAPTHIRFTGGSLMAFLASNPHLVIPPETLAKHYIPRVPGILFPLWVSVKCIFVGNSSHQEEKNMYMLESIKVFLEGHCNEIGCTTNINGSNFSIHKEDALIARIKVYVDSKVEPTKFIIELELVSSQPPVINTLYEKIKSHLRGIYGEIELPPPPRSVVSI